MDLDDAIASHAEWKKRLTDYLRAPDQSLDPGVVGRDDVCELGQWIHEPSGERDPVRSTRAFSELREHHAKFHEAAADVVRRANDGQHVTAEAALGSGSVFARYSSMVVRSIMQVRASLRKH